MFHPLSTPFCCIETVAKNALNHRRIVIFDQLWTNAALTLNRALSLTNFHAKWWIHCLLISSTPLLSHATSIYDRPKRVWGVFLVFSRTTAEFGRPERSASFVFVRSRRKLAYHLLTVVSESNWQSVEWTLAGESCPKQIKTQTSADKVLASVFWDVQSIFSSIALRKEEQWITNII